MARHAICRNIMLTHLTRCSRTTFRQQWRHHDGNKYHRDAKTPLIHLDTFRRFFVAGVLQIKTKNFYIFCTQRLNRGIAVETLRGFQLFCFLKFSNPAMVARRRWHFFFLLKKRTINTLTWLRATAPAPPLICSRQWEDRPDSITLCCVCPIVTGKNPPTDTCSARGSRDN